MSQYIFLTQFESDSSGVLYEEESSVIESTFIFALLLENIEKQWPLVEKQVYEEKEENENFLIRYIDGSSVKEIIIWLENLFINLLNRSPTDKNNKENSNELTKQEFIEKGELNKLIEQFRTITNLIQLLKLKEEK